MVLIMLALGYMWNVKCARCGHKGSVMAGVAELAVRRLRCRSCGHAQVFAPEIVRQQRRPAPRRRPARRGGGSISAMIMPTPASAPDLPDDPLDDLFLNKVG